MKKEDISLTDYACVLARMYALITVNKDVDPFTGNRNPFSDELKKELAEIHKFMDQYKCRESDVIDRVRELIPETNWDNRLRKIQREASDLLENSNAFDPRWEEVAKKLKVYSNEGWRDVEKLEDMYELE